MSEVPRDLPLALREAERQFRVERTRSSIRKADTRRHRVANVGETI